MTTRHILTISFVVCALALGACTQQPAPTVSMGEQTLTGLVKPSELSLTRRGTHVLVVDGTPKVYLESAAVNLGPFEGRQAEVEGTVEPNTDSADLPVLVVKQVTGAQSTAMRTWTVPLLGISLDVPRAWQGRIIGESAAFTGSGSTTPVLTVFLEGEGDIMSPSASVSPDVTIGTFSLGMRGGVTLRNNATGNERVQLDLRPTVIDPTRDVLTLLFTPSGEQKMDPAAWNVLVQDVIHSITFEADSSSSSSFPATASGADLPPLSGSGAGMPCGGEAGILCPAGMFCEITDAAANTGRCRSLQ